MDRRYVAGRGLGPQLKEGAKSMAFSENISSMCVRKDINANKRVIYWLKNGLNMKTILE